MPEEIRKDKMDSENIHDKLDGLLSKYISVWLWSILFGGATTLTFSLASIRAYEKWGSLSLVISMFMIMTIVFLLISWVTLFQFLKRHIIPGIFLGDNKVFEKKVRQTNSKYLTWSFMSLIASGIFRLIIELVKNFFDYLL